MSRRLSIQYKSSVNNKQKPKVKFPDELVFLESIKDNDIENVKLMLRRTSADIDINKMNDSGLTALHQAVLENSLEVVKLLLENKADVNCLDEDSWTPLHAAASMGYYDITQYLLTKGADPNALTSENERPIDLVEQDNFPLISLFLNHMKISDNDNDNDDFSSSDLSANSKSGQLNNSLNSSAKNSDIYYRFLVKILKCKFEKNGLAHEIENFVNREPGLYKSKEFIRALTQAVCDSCINRVHDNDFELDKNELKSKCVVITKYLDNTKENELECLNSIYEFVQNLNNPPDFLKRIFSIFYECKVISKDTLESWKKKDISQDKKAIISSLKGFFSF